MVSACCVRPFKWPPGLWLSPVTLHGLTFDFCPPDRLRARVELPTVKRSAVFEKLRCDAPLSAIAQQKRDDATPFLKAEEMLRLAFFAAISGVVGRLGR
jgi:hypothetical protein